MLVKLIEQCLVYIKPQPHNESGEEEEDGSEPHSTAYTLQLCRQGFQCYLSSSASDLMGTTFSSQMRHLNF